MSAKERMVRETEQVGICVLHGAVVWPSVNVSSQPVSHCSTNPAMQYELSSMLAVVQVPSCVSDLL